MITITDNSRSDNSLALCHLFTITLRSYDEVSPTIFRFTDHDVYVKDENNYEYIPLPITFNDVKINTKLESVTTELSISNVTKYLSSELLKSNWRSKTVEIIRLAFTPPTETISGQSYEYGYGDINATYPHIDLINDNVTHDKYTLLKGRLSGLSLTEQTVSATISTQLGMWRKPFPPRTYDQKEFNSIIKAMSEELYWGRLKEI